MYNKNYHRLLHIIDHIRKHCLRENKEIVN
jgi:hypothetical protein